MHHLFHLSNLYLGKKYFIDIADTEIVLSKYLVKISSHVMICSFVC